MGLNYEKTHGFKQILQTHSTFLAGILDSSYVGLLCCSYQPSVLPPCILHSEEDDAFTFNGFFGGCLGGVFIL